MWPYDTGPQTFWGTPPPPLLGLHPPGCCIQERGCGRGPRPEMQLGAGPEWSWGQNGAGWCFLPTPCGGWGGLRPCHATPRIFLCTLGPTAIKEIEGFCNNQDPIFQQPQSLGVLGPRPIPLGSNPRAARLASRRKDVMMPCCWHSGSTTRGPRHGAHL